MIEIRNLRKSYGEFEALRGVSLAIESGGCIGLLGPNGAGKTTLVEILEGLRERTSGEVRVLGLDPQRDARKLRLAIGVQLQATALPQELTVREVMRLYAALYPKRSAKYRSAPGHSGSAGSAATRSASGDAAAGYSYPRALLESVDLASKERSRVRTLSGGERQRLALALALLHDPDLLLLDEPTAALDPVARRAVHDIVERLVAAGKTVLLTTHYIEEAEKLCRRVVMIRRGEIVADGSPFELVGRSAGRSTLWVEVEGPFDDAPLLRAGAVSQGSEGRHRRYSIVDPGAIVVALGDLLRAQGGRLVDLRLKRPTLEDVYLELMGEAGAEAKSA